MGGHKTNRVGMLNGTGSTYMCTGVQGSVEPLIQNRVLVNFCNVKISIFKTTTGVHWNHSLVPVVVDVHYTTCKYRIQADCTVQINQIHIHFIFNIINYYTCTTAVDWYIY